MSRQVKRLVGIVLVALAVASLTTVFTEAWQVWRSPYAPAYFGDRLLLLASPVRRTVSLSCVEEGTHVPAGGSVSLNFRGKEEILATLYWNNKSYVLEKVSDSSGMPHYGQDLTSFQLWLEGHIVHVTRGDTNFYQCLQGNKNIGFSPLTLVP